MKSQCLDKNKNSGSYKRRVHFKYQQIGNDLIKYTLNGYQKGFGNYISPADSI